MKASVLTMTVPPFARSPMLTLSAAGFIATSTFGWSPGVRMSWSAKWTWKPGDARQRAGRRADLGGEVGQRREVVPEDGGLAREAVAGQLHAVAGVAGEADDDPLELLDRLGSCDVSGIAASEWVWVLARPRHDGEAGRAPRRRRPASGRRSRPSGAPSRSTVAKAAAIHASRRQQQRASSARLQSRNAREPDDADVDAELRVRRLAGLDVDARALRDDARVPEAVPLRMLDHRLDAVAEVPQVARGRGLAGRERVGVLAALALRVLAQELELLVRVARRRADRRVHRRGSRLRPTTDAHAEHRRREPPLRDGEHDEPDGERDEGGARVRVQQPDVEERGRRAPTTSGAAGSRRRSAPTTSAYALASGERNVDTSRRIGFCSSPGVVDPVLRQARRDPGSRGRAARCTSRHARLAPRLQADDGEVEEPEERDSRGRRARSCRRATRVSRRTVPSSRPSDVAADRQQVMAEREQLAARRSPRRRASPAG